MNKVMLILCLFGMSCSNDPASTKSAHGDEREGQVAPTSTLKLNNGAKWKSDESTRKNVDAIIKIINDSNNIGEKNRRSLHEHLQIQMDALVEQCQMKGPDHEALHIWLKQILQDVKQLEAQEIDGYEKSYIKLKKDVESFYAFFE